MAFKTKGVAARPRLLIVEDDVSALELLEVSFKNSARTRLAASLTEAKKILAEDPQRRPEIVLLDLRLPDGSGEELLDVCSQYDIPVVVLTAVNEARTAAVLMSRGISDYLTKDASHAEIASSVLRAHEIHMERKRAAELERTVGRFSSELKELRDVFREELWHSSEGSSIRKQIGRRPKLRDVVLEFERRFLLFMLEQYGGHRKATARALGVHINTLLLKMRRHDIHLRRAGRATFGAEGE